MPWIQNIVNVATECGKKSFVVLCVVCYKLRYTLPQFYLNKRRKFTYQSIVGRTDGWMDLSGHELCYQRTIFNVSRTRSQFWLHIVFEKHEEEMTAMRSVYGTFAVL
jgi:hypothetical protein